MQPTHDPDLDHEQHHLAESRAQLIRMRERTAGMDSSAAGDWVSREYLESTFQLRMRQLADDPSIPLFFGRIDYAPVVRGRSLRATVLERRADGEDSYYIGRRHISDPDGDPMVIDWRAPVSLPFYRATRIEPMGIERRRRFGFQHGALTAFEDEDLTAPEERGYSELLEAEIERPRVGPMRDIVATIQPEQDIIVRADLSESICVQGAPGTGKTAVGLHRAAYLLYTHREQLHRQGVLVVGPNASFLRYIRDVLPALGEIDAKQTTIEELVGKATPIAATEPADVATLKGDARLAIVLARALWSHLVPPAESLVVPRGASRWRVATYEAESIVAELRTRGVRYAAARAMLPQSLAHRLLVKMELAGDSPDDRVQNAVARSAPVKAYANALWPAVEPRRLVWRILSDARLPRRRCRRSPCPRRAGAAALDEAAALGRRREVDPGGRGPHRRGHRPRGTHRFGGPHRRRRGPGPVRDDAARAWPAVLDGVRDGARRPRAGHDPVGKQILVRRADPPRQAVRPCRTADPWLPGARRGHRVRRPPAAARRGRPGAADVACAGAVASWRSRRARSCAAGSTASRCSRDRSG